MTLDSTIFSQHPGRKMMGSLISKVNLTRSRSNQYNSNRISLDCNRSRVGNKHSRILTLLQVWWTCITSIHTLLQLLISTMLLMLWQASEDNRKKWSNNKQPKCRCSKCKWWCNSSNSSKCSNSSLILVASHLNSSTARCSRCNSSSNTKDSACNRNSSSSKWCNSSNSHNGKHSSNNRALQIPDFRPIQEALVISARSNLRHKTTISQRLDNTTMDW